MTFDEAERSDWPSPNWFDKEPREEEISRETQGFTSEYLKEIKAIYDSQTESIRSEIKLGICSMCRIELTERESAECYYGDQIHARCALFYNGRSVCRRHVEVHIGSKVDTMVLAGISAGLNKEDLKKLSRLPQEIIDVVKVRLLERGYVKIGGFGLLPRFPKLTQIGKESLYTMIAAYEKDPDFVLFNEKARRIRNVGAESEQ